MPAAAAAAEGEAVTAYRMPAPCANCPFNRTGAGAALRRSLRRGRWAEILRALRSDGHFMCHKTTRETGTGAELICAGSIEWQDKRGLPSQYRRICERLASMRQGGDR
jgi:hypothetical protein